MATKGRDYQSLRQEILAGLTIAASMGYVVIAVPVVLAAANVPATAALFGACLLTGLATIAVGVFARSPVVIAPAIGMLVLFKDFVAPGGGDTRSWQAGLLAVAIAAAVFFLLSLNVSRMMFGADRAKSSLTNPATEREKILFSLPPGVRASIVASIGALLSAFAFQIAKGDAPLFADYERSIGFDPTSKTQLQTRLIWFGVFLGLIAVCDVLLKGRFQKAIDAARAQGKRLEGAAASLGLLIAESAPILSVIALAFVFHPPVMPSTTVEGVFIWSAPGAIEESIAAISQEDMLRVLAFSVLLLSVLLSDFAGSPYDILKHPDYQQHAAEFTSDVDSERRIVTSLRVDATAGLFAPVFGLSPLVYYAESWAGQYNKGKSGVTAIAAAFPFLLLAAAICVCVYVFGISGQSVLALVPPIAIAPVLFYVGLIITTASFSISTPQPGAQGESAAIEAELGFKPAAFATIVTGVTIDVSLGMLSGLIIYILTAGMKGLRPAAPVWWLTGLIIIGKALELIVNSGKS